MKRRQILSSHFSRFIKISQNKSALHLPLTLHLKTSTQGYWTDWLYKPDWFGPELIPTSSFLPEWLRVSQNIDWCNIAYLQNICKALGAHFHKDYVMWPVHPNLSSKTLLAKWPKCCVKPKKAMSNPNSWGTQIPGSFSFCRYATLYREFVWEIGIPIHYILAKHCRSISDEPCAFLKYCTLSSIFVWIHISYT